MATLKIARYRFTFRVLTPMRLPDYAGSTLRGIFGHAFRKINCITSAKDCKGCPVINQCPYSQVFSPHEIPREEMTMSFKNQIPVPYIIEAPLSPSRTYHPKELLQFDMVLMGNALEHIAVIVLAWRRAFLTGIGNTNGTAELVSIEQPSNNNASIYTESNPIIAPHSTELDIPEFTQAQNIHLQLLTPLRIEQKGKVIGPRDITASIFLRHLIRRVTGQITMQDNAAYPIEAIHSLNSLADHIQEDRRLVWQEWARYSSRQKQSIPLGGIVGHWHLEQVPPPLLSLLALAEWLHVGKETTFGLGLIKMVKEAWQPMEIRKQKKSICSNQ